MALFVQGIELIKHGGILMGAFDNIIGYESVKNELNKKCDMQDMNKRKNFIWMISYLPY